MQGRRRSPCRTVLGQCRRLCQVPQLVSGKANCPWPLLVGKEIAQANGENSLALHRLRPAIGLRKLLAHARTRHWPRRCQPLQYTRRPVLVCREGLNLELV